MAFQALLRKCKKITLCFSILSIQTCTMPSLLVTILEHAQSWASRRHASVKFLRPAPHPSCQQTSEIASPSKTQTSPCQSPPISTSHPLRWAYTRTNNDAIFSMASFLYPLSNHYDTSPESVGRLDDPLLTLRISACCQLAESDRREVPTRPRDSVIRG